MELERLSTETGTQLLKKLEVYGTQKEINKAVEEYDGHALALILLGQYIRKVYDGDIRKRDRIHRLTKERTQDRHARRVGKRPIIGSRFLRLGERHPCRPKR
jgi:hypothetical protein